MPATNWVVVAVSADRQRKVVRRDVRVTDGGETTINLALEPTVLLRGIVRYWDGTPASGARVGGGDRVVRTDANGRFELSGVPTGVRTLLAGVDALDAPDNVTRTGSRQVVVRPDSNDDIEIPLAAKGRIRGVVFNGLGGNRVANVRVSIPTVGGFFWVNANANGEYEFNGFNLGGYIVSAPAPPLTRSELSQASSLRMAPDPPSRADRFTPISVGWQVPSTERRPPGSTGRSRSPDCP